jgi:GH25 family lysozyme M1 (1,4-beta-N-acetylmuramidase)
MWRLVFGVVSVLATLGVDVSGLTENFSCLISSGYTFAIVRGYCNYGGVDPNLIRNLNNANSAGIGEVDVYFFPCVPCGSPASQAQALVNALSGQTYGYIWLDIEVYSWSSSQSSNQAFITTLINTLTNSGQRVGIFTNYNNWESIVGINWTGASSLPLWYANYDKNPSFSDFNPFGGWTSPLIKQYLGDQTVCGDGLNLNYSPSNN